MHNTHCKLCRVMCIIIYIGETADTLNALKYCKPRGALCVGITNTGEYVYIHCTINHGGSSPKGHPWVKNAKLGC